MTDDEIDAVGILGTQMRYAGRWWDCGGCVSTVYAGIRERSYMLTRGNEVALMPAIVLEAVRRKAGTGDAP